jgi:sporulation protein YlmC with PRC-barrel domain
MDRFSKNRLVLLAQEIRDIVPDGIVVNDHEAMSEPDELVRLKEIIALQFELLGKPVITNNRKRLGKVNDYAIDTASLYIQKLYVSQSIMKSLNGGQISIGRSQILEITHKKIVVQEPTVSAQEVIPASRPATA